MKNVNAKKNPVTAIKLDGLTSQQLSQLSRRCLETRKSLNAKARNARQASRKAKLSARRTKLEAELKAISS